MDRRSRSPGWVRTSAIRTWPNGTSTQLWMSLVLTWNSVGSFGSVDPAVKPITTRAGMLIERRSNAIAVAYC